MLLCRLVVPGPGRSTRKAVMQFVAQVATESQWNLQSSPAPLAKLCLSLPTFLSPMKGYPLICTQVSWGHE